MNQNVLLHSILLVEDNAMDVDITLESFRDVNVANPFIVCRDGEEAIQFIESHKDVVSSDFPCIVLLDLRLPKIDGLDVLRKIKEDPVWVKTPVVVLTTSNQTTDIDRAYKMGANSYLIKPIDSDAFRELANKIKLYWILTNEFSLEK